MDRIRLGVNVDHIATIRQARGTRYPDPVLAAYHAELAGADQITVHLREDRRHIQERDLRILRQTVTGMLNLEMAMAEDVVAIACDVKPHMATLVPERRQELTTEGGLAVQGQEGRIGPVVDRLHDAGIKVSLFIAPDPVDVRIASELGVDQIELHTGRYSELTGEAQEEELLRIAAAAAEGGRLEIAVAAGHGLDYANVREVCTIPEIEELNIGHSIVARALIIGFEEAVREMLRVMDEATY